MKLQYLYEISDWAKAAKVIQKMNGNPKIGNTPKKGDVVDEYGTIGVINSISRGVAYVKFEDTPGQFAPIILRQLKPSEDGKCWKASFS